MNNTYRAQYLKTSRTDYATWEYYQITDDLSLVVKTKYQANMSYIILTDDDHDSIDRWNRSELPDFFDELDVNKFLDNNKERITRRLLVLGILGEKSSARITI